MKQSFKIRKMTEGNGYVTIWQVSGDIKPQDINEVVYTTMCEVGQDVLEQSVCRLSGEHSAVELAGRISGSIPTFDIPDKMAPEVRINVGLITVGYKQQAPMFTCSFRADTVFEQIAEQEGVMNMAPKKVRKFKCVAKEETKSIVLKPYVRCHGYLPRRISYAGTEKNINKKFETLGLLYQALTSEGIRKAMSVVAAARCFENMSYGWLQMAKEVMLRKLWKDYGKDKASKPIPFSELDFKYGPDCYKQVDEVYALELKAYFMRMKDAAQKPEWPGKGDVVTFKDCELVKKYQGGKYLCEGLVARLSADGERIEWVASVRVKKYDNEYFLPEQLEAWTAPKTTKKKQAKVSKPAPEAQASEMSLAEQFRKAFLARLAA